MPPRPPGYGLHRELFPRTTGEGFDPVTRPPIAADVTIGFMLQPDRAARMVAQYAVDQSLRASAIIDKLTKATFDRRPTATYEAEVRRAEERVLVDRVMWLAHIAPNAQVRAIASLKLQRAGTRLRAKPAETEPIGAAHADRRRHQALPRAPGRGGEDDPAVTGAARRADRRHGPGLAGETGPLRLGSGLS